jgi:bisphosphoglycerate-dependent phosphoglycerate mutase
MILLELYHAHHLISNLSRNGEGLGIFPLLQCRDFDHWLAKDVRYKQLEINIEDLPRSESLKNITLRSSQFWDEVIIPRLRIKKRVIIVGQNNLRSIRWYIRRCDHIH